MIRLGPPGYSIATFLTLITSEKSLLPSEAIYSQVRGGGVGCGHLWLSLFYSSQTDILFFSAELGERGILLFILFLKFLKNEYSMSL